MSISSLRAGLFVRHNSERGFLDFSILSFLLGAATLYFIFSSLGRINTGSGRPNSEPFHSQYSAATPSFAPALPSLNKLAANLGVSDALASADDAYGSAVGAYGTAADTAVEAYDSARAGARSMGRLAASAMGDLSELQHAASSDIRRLGIQALSFSSHDLGLGRRGKRGGLGSMRLRRSL